jgi:hypothetical protein
VATITLKATRSHAVARFWRDLLGYVVAPNASDSALLVDPTGRGPSLLVQPAEDEPGAGAIHLDLRPADQAAMVDRALGLGARRLDVGQSGDEGWVVLADPGGNAFCILSASDPSDACCWETPIDDAVDAPEG